MLHPGGSIITPVPNGPPFCEGHSALHHHSVRVRRTPEASEPAGPNPSQGVFRPPLHEPGIADLIRFGALATTGCPLVSWGSLLPSLGKHRNSEDCQFPTPYQEPPRPAISQVNRISPARRTPEAHNPQIPMGAWKG